MTGDPPQLILDTSAVPRLGYNNFPMSLIPELEPVVHDGYDLVNTVDGVDIWRRR